MKHKPSASINVHLGGQASFSPLPSTAAPIQPAVPLIPVRRHTTLSDMRGGLSQQLHGAGDGWSSPGGMLRPEPWAQLTLFPKMTEEKEQRVWEISKIDPVRLAAVLLALSPAKSGSARIMAFRKAMVPRCTDPEPSSNIFIPMLSILQHSLNHHTTFYTFKSIDHLREGRFRWHVCGLILDSVLCLELRLNRSSETAASPFDPSSEIHLDHLIYGGAKCSLEKQRRRNMLQTEARLDWLLVTWN